MQRLKSLIHQNLFPQALKTSFSLHTPHLTDSTYALFIKSGHHLDAFLSSALITHFSLSGDFSRAAQFLHDTPRPDTVVYNSLISGYAKYSRPEPAFELFNDLRKLGLYPDVYTTSAIISACENLDQNEMAHCGFLKMGFVGNVFLVSGLVENYSKFGFVGDAEKCFEECLVLDCVVWTAMINGFVWNGVLEKAREMFLQMRCFGLGLNEFSLTSVLGALFYVKECEQIHGFGFKMGFLCGCSSHLNNALMNMYTRCGYKCNAVKVFEENPKPDVVSWAGRIYAAYDGAEALEMFKVCVFRGLEINEYIMINTLSAVDGRKTLEPGKQIHAFCHKDGYLFETSVCSALISMYGKSGQMGDARRVFDDMIFQDTVSWNSLITGYSENGLTDQAFAVLCQMRELSIEINKYTLASVLEATPPSNAPTQVMQIHSLIMKLGFMSDDSVQTCLITAYGKCNRINESKRLFNEIEQVDVVHLNALAGTYTNAGCHADILNLFQRRWNLSLEVDHVTFTMLFKACGVLTNLDHGKTFHSLALKSGIDTDLFIESALIDLYCKCGSITDAGEAFKKTSKHNLAAWNAMMMGYAQCGRYHEVYSLLNRMPNFGVRPDEITYLGVLSSCCHAGLVDEAKYHLNSMFDLHGVIPCLEHYACVVDVLGRVGHLEEAKRTIDQMSVLPDAHIWQILLSACSVRGNIDLGKVAARKLLEFQPENESAFILLSNLYASAGMWDAVGELRREMKEKTVCKEPGYSWTQVKGAMYYFLADDASHPDSREIYMKLQILMKQISELHDQAEISISLLDL